VCEREASRTGRTVEQCVSEFLLKHGHRPLPELTDSSAARHRSEWNGIWGQGVAATPVQRITQKSIIRLHKCMRHESNIRGDCLLVHLSGISFAMLDYFDRMLRCRAHDMVWI
jgi:hypothetical protein